MRYAAFETLVAPARASAHPLRLLIGAVLTVAMFVPLAFVYAGLAAPLTASDTPPVLGRSPRAVLVLLFQFTLLIVALALALRLVHRRGLASLVGPGGRAVAQFLRCLCGLLPLYLLALAIPLPEPWRLSPNLPPGTWFSWLPLALPAVMIQIGAEELAFRGYLQSQLAARFRHPAVWIGLPSALFGMMHYTPGYAADTVWAVVLWSTLFGAAAADLTARAGTLGPAFALHAANNVFAILVTAPAGDLDGLALYTVPLDFFAGDLPWYVFPVETAFTLCTWLAARLALRV